jgi:histidine triad (HIT) family protein
MLTLVAGFATANVNFQGVEAMAAPTYDESNIFAKILRGEVPCHKVYEDGVALAIMDVMPQADGHVLVIPKAPSRNILDADPDVLAALIQRVQKLARAVKAAVAADGVTILQFNESSSGQTVFQLHFHIVPRWEGVPLRPHSGVMANPEGLAERAKTIAAAIADD